MRKVDDKEKVSLREKCNFLLDSVVNLHMSFYPDLRYIQNLWALGIIDSYYVQNEGQYVQDRFYEEPYDTIVRILPRIVKMVNEEDFSKKVTDRLKRANIFTYLKELGLAEKTEDFKLIPKE